KPRSPWYSAARSAATTASRGRPRPLLSTAFAHSAHAIPYPSPRWVTSRMIELFMRDVTQRGEGYGIACAEWANAVLSNGLGLPRDAVVAAERAAEYHGDLGFYRWALVELVEAAVHSGKTETAADAYRRLTETTSPAGTDWALGLAARSRALLSDGAQAEDGYREAISRLDRPQIRV